MTQSATPPSILLVEDDASIALVVETALGREGYRIDRADSIAARNRALTAQRYALMITDVVLPDGNGLTDLAGLRDMYDIGSVIVLSAQNTLNTAIRAAEEGAFEYLPKPFDLNELNATVRSALARAPQAPSATADQQTSDPWPLIGRAQSMQDVYRTIAKLSTNDLSVLVLGESGTGKELVAQAIHQTGRRRDGPFVAVNMAAIPRDLIEAELFGHEKGAFTGAHARAIGRFEQANGGTLFLDEIGDMPMEAQTRLLRVLQSGDFLPVGGSRPIKANSRVVAATNQNLPALIRENRFREDLYYRLNVIPVTLPPLRDRKEDIPALVNHFITLSADEGLPEKIFSFGALRALEQYDWPGNIRELKNVVQRALILSRGQQVMAEDLATALDASFSASDAIQAEQDSLEIVVEQTLNTVVGDEGKIGRLYDDMLEKLERPLIRYLLRYHDGNQVRVAEHLGINRNTLRKKILHLGLR